MEEGFSFFCKRTLVSSSPVEPGKTYELSPLDLLMENHHLQMIYYYMTPMGFALGELTKDFREYMSQVMSHFPIVVGRLVKNDKEQWMIKCNDAGARIVESRAKGSVESWLANVDDEKEKKLVHWEDMFDIPYFWPTLYIKVTEFEDGGLAVGLSCAHMIADPICATLLMKAWADIMLSGKMSVPPFFHPLPKQKVRIQDPLRPPNAYFINHYKSLLKNSTPSMTQKTKTITFEFTHQTVQTCIDLAQLGRPTNGLETSPFIALAGLLWVCISRVKSVSNGLINMSICSDMRKVLGLDQGFFGNCMIHNKVHGEGIGVDDLALATKAVREACRNVDKEAIMDLIEWLDHGDSVSPPLQLNDGDLVFINLENLDPYSTTFMESYEPIRVSYYSESVVNKGTVLVLPSHPRRGQLSRTLMITLPSHEVVKLCEDKFLARFSPTIIMGAEHNL